MSRACGCSTNRACPFLLSGTYALSCYTGITRPTKDLDVFCKPRDAPKILSFFKEHGYRIEIEDERWIGKVWKGEHFFDVIYNISTASIPITDDWFREAYEVEVYGTNVRITPPTEFILSKLFLQDRYRYDGADVAHVILKKHDEIDWQQLLERDGALLGGAADPRPQFPLHLPDRARVHSALAVRRAARAAAGPGRDAGGADADLPRPAVQPARLYHRHRRMGLRRRRRQGDRGEA